MLLPFVDFNVGIRSGLNNYFGGIVIMTNKNDGRS